MVLAFETNPTSNEKKIFNNLGGPHGLGDPNDRSLRRVEKEVMIPKIMRDRAKEMHCSKEVKEFESCCKNHNLLMVIKCRQENSALKDCLGKWYKNEQFQNECKEIYLEERAEYRRTGIPKKHRVQKI
ncbi:COX assembly mitochondrial protein homolog [Condylostylus longicornis]|uniref:COX assembly mitochondrial protein homolog n=1 Tax=Condylostylus longicornis TaxID=2530218 RepID=UPI00244DAFA0|nr:COX assembly mitochondrial protein homolog [Condylostylus longicornis]